jgi:hypothetical protein
MLFSKDTNKKRNLISFSTYYKNHPLERISKILENKLGYFEALGLIVKSKGTKKRRQLLTFICHNYSAIPHHEWLDYASFGLYDYERTRSVISIPEWNNVIREIPSVFPLVSRQDIKKGFNYIKMTLCPVGSNESNHAIETYGFLDIPDFLNHSVEVLHRRNDFTKTGRALQNCMGSRFQTQRLNIVIKKDDKIKGVLVLDHSNKVFFIGKNYSQYSEADTFKLIQHIQKYTTKCDFSRMEYETHGARNDTIVTMK